MISREAQPPPPKTGSSHPAGLANHWYYFTHPDNMRVFDAIFRKRENWGVTFLRDKPTPKQVASLDDVCGGDEFALVGRDLVVRYPNGYAAATLTAARIEKHLGAVGTARNWRTVEKVAELMRR